MALETLLYETTDRVATITLNRPERRNAFDLTMAQELVRLWQEVKADPEVRCVILTGAGDQALCTGVDVKAIAASGGFEPNDAPDEKPAFLRMTALANRCWKPVITAVNGMVCGGGLHFVADSDLVICAEHATFFDTHVRIGTLSAIEPVHLARRIPLEAVMRLALLGGDERIDARQALALGLVGEIVPREQLLPRARELAARIARHSPTALARSKQVIWESLELGLSAAHEHAWQAIREHRRHPDPAEGTRALLEKREPRWAPYLGS